MDIQKLVDAMGAAGRMARKDYHLTLGGAIEALESASPDVAVVFDYTAAGPSFPHSYRGYYSDLSFSNSDGVTAERFLADCRRSLNETFEGYKGGDFVMGADTPLWNASYGCTGRAITGLVKVAGKIILTTKEID